MLKAKVEITGIDYEKSVVSVLEKNLSAVICNPKAGIAGALLEKLGDSAPDVLCHMIGYINGKARSMLLCETANHFQENITDTVNAALAADEIGRNIVFGRMRFVVCGGSIVIYIYDIQVDYAGILDNDTAQEQIECFAREYIDTDM